MIRYMDRMMALPFRTVAFLQNQWFKDPEAARRTFARHDDNPSMRSRLVAAFLFAGCTTGRRLKLWMGEDIEDIIWVETTKVIGGVSSSRPAPDPIHIDSVLDTFQPHVVICFGKQAEQAIQKATWHGPTIITKHPAARPCPTEEVEQSLKSWRLFRVEFMKKGGSG